jgi:hypothetical protein
MSLKIRNSIFVIILYERVNLTETNPFFICPNGCAEQLPSSVYGTWYEVYNFD